METKINCFAFSKPERTILFVKQQKMSNNFSDKIMASTKIQTISKQFLSTFEDTNVILNHILLIFTCFQTFLNKMSDKLILFSQLCINFWKVT